MESIKAKTITKGVWVEIVTALAFEIWNHTQYPSGDEYNAVCTMLVNKYPILKDTIGNGYVSLTIVFTKSTKILLVLLIIHNFSQHRDLGNYRYDKN